MVGQETETATVIGSGPNGLSAAIVYLIGHGAEHLRRASAGARRSAFSGREKIALRIALNSV
jgi:hypothetical protein